MGGGGVGTSFEIALLVFCICKNGNEDSIKATDINFMTLY